MVLVYVFDFIVKSYNFISVDVLGYDFYYMEYFEFVYKFSMVLGWFNWFVDLVKSVIL